MANRRFVPKGAKVKIIIRPDGTIEVVIDPP